MLAGIILAGGQSRRMGTDKCALFLPHKQLSLLEHSCALLTALCAEQVFISGAQHAKGITDIHPNCGPLAGLQAVIKAIEAQGLPITELLVVPVDMPSLQEEDLAYLLTMGRKQQRACYFESCFLPAYLPLSTALKVYLTQLFLGESSSSIKVNYSIKALLQALAAKPERKLEDTNLSNINTPQEWHDHLKQLTLSKV